MADLQLPPVMPAQSHTSSGFAAASQQPSELDLLLSRQTVLKLTELSSQRVASLPPAIAEQIVQPWQRLIKVIEELKTVEGGDIAAVPHTPEAIAPYVFEEAYDVLEVLQSPIASQSALDPSGLQEPYLLLETLAPYLLWCLASSSDRVMQLVEGISAKVFQPQQGWQTGVLRLAALLNAADSGGEPELIDLATYEAPQAWLTSSAIVQSEDCTLCQAAIEINALLQELHQIVQRSTALRPFLEGTAAEILAPGKLWQLGSIQLHLKFEFVTATEDAVVDWVLNTDSQLAAEIVVPTALAATQPAVLLKPKVQFTDAAWLNQYTAAIDRQQWQHLLPQLPALWALHGTSAAADSIPLLVEQACEALELLHPLQAIWSTMNLSQAIDWEMLLHWLRWRFSSSTYEIMQLVGGISVSVLQPNAVWLTGTLRLRVILMIKTPECDWQVDLATGLPPHATRFSLAADAIARPHCDWWYSPQRLTDLLQQVQSQLDQTAPELQLFLQGTSVDVLTADHCWQPGAIQLKTDFDFTPRFS